MSVAQALTGLFILRVASIDEAKATVSTDPAVKAGRFTYEGIPWMDSRTLEPLTFSHPQSRIVPDEA